MKMTNDELFMLNDGLNELAQITLKAKLALKVFKIKKKIEDELIPTVKAIQAVEEKEEKEKIAQEDVEIELDLITIEEIEEIEEIKPATLLKIKRIIESEGE